MKKLGLRKGRYFGQGHLAVKWFSRGSSIGDYVYSIDAIFSSSANLLCVPPGSFWRAWAHALLPSLLQGKPLSIQGDQAACSPVMPLGSTALPPGLVGPLTLFCVLEQSRSSIHAEGPDLQFSHLLQTGAFVKHSTNELLEK